MIPWGLRVPIWKINFCSNVLRLSELPRCKERPQTTICCLERLGKQHMAVCGVSVHLGSSITYKELYAITMALTAWAPSLATQSILFHCENPSVVRILTSDSSKCRHIMSLARYIFLIWAKSNILLKAIVTKASLTIPIAYKVLHNASTSRFAIRISCPQFRHP